MGRNDNIANRLESRKTQIESREQSQGLKTQFKVQFQEFLFTQQSGKLSGPVITDNLQFWIEHLSWMYCNTCKVLKMQSLLPNYFKRPSIKYANDYTCIKKVHINPALDKIPDVLKGLAHNDIIVLRPFEVHIGDYVKKPNGYRQKNNLFRLRWSTKSVWKKINDLTCLDSRNRCIKAYEFLMKN